ncbi:MAG: peptide-methionine (S)-S-oxide reductase MsrA [Rubrivivax sp.]|nr:peptide-methionine (S)-S-oxide reductase MsrA [Rubrivivax sp.]
MKRRWSLGVATALLVAVVAAMSQNKPAPAPSAAPSAAPAPAAPAAPPATAAINKATFAGGCFWCVEADFDKVPGVISTTSGYIGGTVANPSYAQVSANSTGHAEAVEIVYDPARVSYAQLLQTYFRSIDPTTKDRQFCDVGSPYRTAIFTHGAEQATAAQASLAALDKDKPFVAPIVTTIEPAGPFYPAEAYHQDYYKKNPVRYGYYRTSCGRDARLKQLWATP